MQPGLMFILHLKVALKGALIFEADVITSFFPGRVDRSRLR